MSINVVPVYTTQVYLKPISPSMLLIALDHVLHDTMARTESHRVLLAWTLEFLQYPHKCIMAFRTPVDSAIEYGNAVSFWVEYPSGLVDLSRSRHISDTSPSSQGDNGDSPPQLDSVSQLDIPVDGARTIRIDKARTAMVIIDMQKYICLISRK